MFRKIIGTIGTRLLSAIITLVIVVMNAHLLGAKNVGTISLIILAITLIQLLNNFVGGPALVYLVPRTEIFKLFFLSYLWAVVTSVVGATVMQFAGLIPDGFFIHVMVLSLFLSLSFVNSMILMGLERVKPYNIISLIQIAVLFCVLMISFFVFRHREVMSYIYGLYGSYISAFIFSLIITLPVMRRSGLSGSGTVLKEILRYGSVMQAGNIFQMLNYRLSFYFIEKFLGRAAVGVYSVGVQLSEGIWIISRSISVVQYSRISNSVDPKYAITLTITLVKIAVIVTILALLIILLFPASFFTLIFGPEFAAVKMIMFCLATGILVLSVSMILSPYFSGIGKPHHNTISAAIGLIFTIAGSWVLIPKLGIVGAGLSATVSYSAATLYQVITFIRFTKVGIKDLMITKGELILFKSEIIKLLKKGEPVPGNSDIL